MRWGNVGCSRGATSAEASGCGGGGAFCAARAGEVEPSPLEGDGVIRGDGACRGCETELFAFLCLCCTLFEEDAESVLLLAVWGPSRGIDEDLPLLPPVSCFPLELLPLALLLPCSSSAPCSSFPLNASVGNPCAGWYASKALIGA